MHHLLRFEEHLLKTKVPSSFKKIFNNEKCMCDPFLNIYIIRCKEKPTVKLVSIFMKFVDFKKNKEKPHPLTVDSKQQLY